MFVTQWTAEHFMALFTGIIILVLVVIYRQNLTLIRLTTAALLPRAGEGRR